MPISFYSPAPPKNQGFFLCTGRFNITPIFMSHNEGMYLNSFKAFSGIAIYFLDWPISEAHSSIWKAGLYASVKLSFSLPPIPVPAMLLHFIIGYRNFVVNTSFSSPLSFWFMKLLFDHCSLLIDTDCTYLLSHCSIVVIQMICVFGKLLSLHCFLVSHTINI